jgi:hypothetical protein
MRQLVSQLVSSINTIKTDLIALRTAELPANLVFYCRWHNSGVQEEASAFSKLKSISFVCGNATLKTHLIKILGRKSRAHGNQGNGNQRKYLTPHGAYKGEDCGV